MRLMTFISILTLILISLLASPVAATVTFNIEVETRNNSGTPSVSLITPAEANYTRNSDGSGLISFHCQATMIDNVRTASDHYVELNVQKVFPLPVGTPMVTSTGIITVKQTTIIRYRKEHQSRYLFI